mgnify:CR=1 FL=1
MNAAPASRIGPDDPILVIGALHVDELYWPTAALAMRASNPVRRERRVGGVAANVARAARAERTRSRGGEPTARPVMLCAALGDDGDGQWLRAHLCEHRIDDRTVLVAGASSGRYTVVHDDDGDLLVGLADVDVAERLDAASVFGRLDREPAVIAVDANLSPACLDDLLSPDGSRIDRPSAWRDVARIAFAVSPVKAARLAPHLPAIDLLYCNRREAAALGRVDVDASTDTLADALQGAGCRRFVLSDGGAPALVHEPAGRRSLPVPAVSIAGSVNGAGDALAGASLAHWLAHADLAAAVAEAGIPAALAILGREAGPPDVATDPCSPRHFR